MHVSIALATYNGERFLGAQLASLARQTWQPHELVVTDDGSTDATLEIVAKFAKTSLFPVRLYANSSRLGFAENFVRAASRCTGAAIAFCDQDDVWREDKLARCIAELAPRDVGLVLHQYVNTDENLRPVGALIPRKTSSVVFEKLQADRDLVSVAGCVMVVKRGVIEEVNRCWPEHHLEMVQRNGRSVLSHDCVTFYVANGLGKVSYLAQPLLWHRMHQNNACTVNTAFRYSVKRALQAGVAEHRRRSYLNRAKAEMYESMAARAADAVSESLLKFAGKLRILAKVNEARARLYGLHSVSLRTAAILEMIWAGVYSNADGKLGKRALLADLAFSAFPRIFAGNRASINNL